jgi:predicted N-acyltransferase
VPFTPVPGNRLLAQTPAHRAWLMQAVLQWAAQQNLSSVHLLFGADEDHAASTQAGLLLRHNVQFHWSNTQPGYADFEHFLSTLTQKKRKNIRQERRKVADAGVVFRWAQGADIALADWAFFYRCYAQTYQEHGNAPYLSADFFQRMACTMPENWVLFIAERAGQAIASSLIAIQAAQHGAAQALPAVAYGRYWGALARVDCLHFEACYYQPLQWCIAHGYQRFEGGAQGEYKMARALLPVKTSSAHHLAQPAFAAAIGRFLERENQGIDLYMGQMAATH